MSEFVDHGDGVCTCGKVRYVSKAAARKVKKEKHWLGLTVYECLGYYHLGHPDRGSRNTRRARARKGR